MIPVHASVPKLLATMPGQPDTDQPSLERRISGAPRRETWNVVDQPVAASRLYCGVWRCEPGHWRIAFPDHEHELFTVLQGRCRVHDEQGSFQEAGPGEALFIPGGFRGSFEVLETVIKTYMIVSPQA